MAHRPPKNMAYEPPPFYAIYEPFLLGVGVVFDLLRVRNRTVLGQPPQPSAEPLRTILGQRDPLGNAWRPLVSQLGSQAEACQNYSEAWGPPQFLEKCSRSERAILGALGEFRGILGAALGIGNSILGIRNSILGMASHDLINTKPTIL